MAEMKGDAGRLAGQLEEAVFVDIEVIVDIDDIQKPHQCEAPQLGPVVDADVEGVKGRQAITVIGDDFL